MLTEPEIVERPERAYAGVRKVVGMGEISRAADELAPKLFAWLESHRVAPAGPPFFKYNLFSGDGQIEIEWGIPIETPIIGDDGVLTGVLPGGRYATLTHRGPYHQLRDANAALLNWVADKSLSLDVVETEAGARFGSRLEIYLTDPRAEPDSQKWETKVAFRLAEQAAAPKYSRAVTVTRVFDAPRALVFKAWTDAKHLAEWWGPESFTNPVCEIDARPGGRLRIVMRAPDGSDHPMTGVIREIIEAERLVFTMTAFDAKDGVLLEGLTTATFAEENGKTRLTVEARAAGSAEIVRFMLDGMVAGWSQSLDSLAKLLARLGGRAE